MLRHPIRQRTGRQSLDGYWVRKRIARVVLLGFKAASGPSGNT